MKDKEVKLEEIEDSHTPGGTGEGRVQGRVKWGFPIIPVPHSCSLFRSVPFLPLHTVCWFLVWGCCVGLPKHSLYHCVRLIVCLYFGFPSEYLQIFLGIPDSGILPDTSVICHDSP